MRVGYRDLVVFTRDGAGGNPLAVIEFGDVPSSRWQETAAAIGYSESVFVERGEVATVHIYTPGRRMAFAGHPLVGTAFVLGPGTSAIRYDTGVAAVEHHHEAISVTVTSDGAVSDTVAPPFGIRAHFVEMPLPYLVVQAPDVDTVASLRLEDVAGLDEAYVWAWEAPGERVRTRFFAAGVGVDEDAATGSAAVALSRVLPDEIGSLVIHQGEEMGRPSLIRLNWKGTVVTIGGSITDCGTSVVTLD